MKIRDTSWLDEGLNKISKHIRFDFTLMLSANGDTWIIQSISRMTSEHHPPDKYILTGTTQSTILMKSVSKTIFTLKMQ